MAKSKKKNTKPKAKSKTKEKEFEEKIEKGLQSKFCCLATEKIVGEVIGYGIFLLFLYVIFPKTAFITDDYSLWQPIAFWTTTISTLLRILKHTNEINFLKQILEIVSIALSVYSTYMLLAIYPLDFSKVGFTQIDEYFPSVLKIAIYAMYFAMFVNFIRIFIPEKEKV